MDAIGYSGARIREEIVDIYYDGVIAVKGGIASLTPFQKLQEVAAKKRFKVTIDLHLGPAEYIVYTTDLSTEYVKLNMGE
jgi:glutamate N-acetyltransferase/amino-acid N-acetyltransferase